MNDIKTEATSFLERLTTFLLIHDINTGRHIPIVYRMIKHSFQ